MYSNKLYTPLRYPGGKARFAPFIAKIMEVNGISGGHYFEPYAGGAGVALELLFHGHASHVHINDLDPAIYSFWKAVTSYPDEILKLLETTHVSMEQWFKWRSILRREVSASIVEQGFATLFMNRTNRSGILKAGVIGGLAQNGDYKIDARYNKTVLASRIIKIAEHAKQITVYSEDALILLRRSKNLFPKNSLIYLDPPYYVKGQGLYRNFYKHQDHLEIANILQSSKFLVPWVVSYDNAPEICDMYQFSQALTYDLNYTAQKRYVGNEVMFFHNKLFVPKEEIPQSKLAA